MKNKLVLRALLNSLGVLIYTSALAAFFFNANRLFGKEDNFLMPAVMMMLLVISAALTGALVLGKPILLYLNNQKSEALKLFGWTLGWLAIIISIVLGSLVVLK